MKIYTKQIFNTKMTKRPDKINKTHNEIGSRPKLEPYQKQAQGPAKIKTTQVARTKWGVYIVHIILVGK